MNEKLVYALRDYTRKEIAALKEKYPQGWHKTHGRNGNKLPYNGVFFTKRP
jgi:hypothetical protein